jgi:hypothetical protein
MRRRKPTRLEAIKTLKEGGLTNYEIEQFLRKYNIE